MAALAGTTNASGPRGVFHPAVLYPAVFCLLAAIGAGAGFDAAHALTQEEARERCRESVGRPIVQNCMKSGGGDREACRAKASPAVRACVQKAMNAAHGRANKAVALPEEKHDPDLILMAPAATFVAPPRTISDIAAILDSERPDPAKISELKTAADAEPPSGLNKSDLAWFYYQRGNARALLARRSGALADAEKAVAVGQGAADANRMCRLLQFAGLQQTGEGNLRQALAHFQTMLRTSNTRGAKGFQFNAYRQISGVLLQMGDVDQAEAYSRRSQAAIREARTSGLPGWRNNYARAGQSWESDYEAQRASILEARGQFGEAEEAYRLSEQRRRAGVAGILDQKNAPPEAQILAAADGAVASQARMKLRQGRLAEAEAEARRALMGRLKVQGKYHAGTPRYILGLSAVLAEQGRYDEAATLVRSALDIVMQLGIANDAELSVRVRSNLANVLTLQRRGSEAAEVYAAIDKDIAGWEPARREVFALNGGRIASLYASGQIAAGLDAAQALLKRLSSRLGDNHFDTAAARGQVAVGYAKAGRHAEAIAEFKAAIPLFVAAVRERKHR